MIARLVVPLPDPTIGDDRRRGTAAHPPHAPAPVIGWRYRWHAGLTPAINAGSARTKRTTTCSSRRLAEGTFTYTPPLTRFTLRYLLKLTDLPAADADQAVLVEGELLAADFLESRGITHKPLTVSAVYLQDVKVRRRR